MKKVRVIYVGWGERWHLGTLADDGQKLLFEYSPEALQQQLELSPRHLKLRSAAYGDFPEFMGRLPGFIADALPDGWGMLLMDKLFRKKGLEPSQISPLDRLSFIGDRAMGALVFEPEMEIALAPAAVALQTLAEESQLMLSDVDTAALQQLALMGGSPQGARPKVLVHWDRNSGQMSTIPFATSTPWLVKFQAQQEHKEVCAVECLYALLARECKLDMPDTHYFDLGKNLAGFGIQRFDREGTLRVPVMTLAGFLQVDFRLPSLDYLTFLRVTHFLTKNESDVQSAFDRAVFNILFHNRDDHAKNFSFRLNQSRQWRLAPCYDLTFNEGPGGEHSMDVGGVGRNIQRAHLLALASQLHLDEMRAKDSIDRMLSVADQFVHFAKNYAIRKKTVMQLRAFIQANQTLLT